MKTCFSLTTILLAAAWLPVWSTLHLNPQVDDKIDPTTLETVRAKQFELIDSDGRVRISMQMKEGNPVINLKDEEGKDRVLIFHQSDASGVYLNDSTEHTRVGLAQFPHGGGLAMHGPDGKGSAVYVLMNGRARMDVYNTEGTLTDRWPNGEQTSKKGLDK